MARIAGVTIPNDKRVVIALTSRSRPAIVSTEKGRVWLEKDDKGSRHDTESKASVYWMSRISMPRKDPYVLYSFDSEADARAALLEVPCIVVATDTGNLICTEVLTYGTYPAEGRYEAVLCGDDLTWETWSKAKASFIKHGGKPRNEGQLEPEKRVAARPAAPAATPSAVRFIREDRKPQMGHVLVYRIHSAPNAASAKAFLEQNPVSQKLYYIVVETPEGNYCRDIQGIYKE